MYIEGDIPTTVSTGNGGNGGFMNGDSPFWAIILLAIIFGWNGNRGFGGGSGSDGGVMNNYVLTSDFSQLSRQIDSGFASQETKLDGINNGLCSLGYQELQNMLKNKVLKIWKQKNKKSFSLLLEQLPMI